jgi:hypothetical protein
MRVVVVLRRGMNVPSASYVEKVLAEALPDALADGVTRVGLSQPVWYKDAEGADNICAGLAETFAPKYGLEAPSTRRIAADGPDGCACLIVELTD